MIIGRTPVVLASIAWRLASEDKRSVTSDLLDRLIRIALALYLTPALLVVLAVGGMGITVLAMSRWITGLIQDPLS
jgi:hypothetical protein